MQKVLLAVIAASVVTIGLTVNYSGATHEPADKTAGAANSVDEVGNDAVVLLEETMRVSSTSDLILATTAECSILTSLHTEGGPTAADSPEADGAFGQVELWITVDGKRVPVSSTQQGDDGEVVFCNRAYQRKVTDREENEGPLIGGNQNGDGIDEEDDFIRTRTANAFNWMAFNAGKAYDAGKDNIVTIKLHGRFTRQSSDGTADCGTRQADNALAPYTNTCADAFVGKRSLIVEAVHASNHEQTSPGANVGQ